jgi:hypothetical protein
VEDPADNDKLHAFVHNKGDGKKGGNNVTSSTLKSLRIPEVSLMEQEEAGKELNFVLDNCSGKNKNRMVLVQLANLLVKIGVFKKVNFLFLVQGHAKNPCICLQVELRHVKASHDSSATRQLRRREKWSVVPPSRQKTVAVLKNRSHEQQ